MVFVAAAAAAALGLLLPRKPPAAEIAQATSVVRIPGFLDDTDTNAVLKLGQRVSDEVGEVESGNLAKASGAWRTTYLNHRLSTELPDLLAKIVEAARAADTQQGWNVLRADTSSINLRCAELHQVLRSGGLPKKQHHDVGSLITIDIMLSSSTEFRGGQFQTLEVGHGDEGQHLKPHAFEATDALIFLSHKYHCVSPVTAGRRQVLVCELWSGVQRRCARRCNDPWGPCACRYQHISQYRRPREMCAMPAAAPTERTAALEAESRRRSGAGCSHRIFARRYGERAAVDRGDRDSASALVVPFRS